MSTPPSLQLPTDVKVRASTPRAEKPPLNVLMVEKDGKVRASCVKDFSLEDLYKKCGYKKASDFVKHADWVLPEREHHMPYGIELYGKTGGRANNPNEYVFPSPVDKTTFYGTCVLLGYVLQPDGERKYVGLTVEVWERIYDLLCAGIDEIGSQDSERSEDDEYVPRSKRTRHGYHQDGFVVDDSEDDDPNLELEEDPVPSTPSETVHVVV